MSPTFALKHRLEFQKNVPANTAHLIPSPCHFVTIGSDGENQDADRRFETSMPSDEDAAKLLLSISSIVSNEMKLNSNLLQDEDPSLFLGGKFSKENLLTPSCTSSSDSDDLFRWSRARSVSIDSPVNFPTEGKRSLTPSFDPVIVSPVASPRCDKKGRTFRKESLSCLLYTSPSPRD